MSNYFIELIFLSTFFFTICISKKILLYFNVTPLIGEILTGIILGPNLLNIVPYHETFKFLGYLGMLLLMIESGLDFDINKIKNIWKDSLIIAVSGSILPFLFGFFNQSCYSPLLYTLSPVRGLYVLLYALLLC